MREGEEEQLGANLILNSNVIAQVALTQQYLSVLYELREVVRVKGRRNSWAPIQDKGDLGTGRAWAEVYRGPDHIVFGHDSGRGFQVFYPMRICYPAFFLPLRFLSLMQGSGCFVFLVCCFLLRGWRCTRAQITSSSAMTRGEGSK